MSKKYKKERDGPVDPDTCKHIWYLFSMNTWGDNDIRAHFFCEKCGVLKIQYGSISKFKRAKGFANAKERL